MLDELDRLRESAALRQLLDHYTQRGAADDEAWQDRLMVLAGVKTAELVRLHGELIAWSWVEQNTGNVPVLQPAAVPSCYRATAAGRRALRWAQAEHLPEAA